MCAGYDPAICWIWLAHSPLLFLSHSTHRPTSGLFLYALHPLFVAVAGGSSREDDVLIGNKRCAFLPSSFLPALSERTVLEDREDVLTLKVDIFVPVYGWKHPRPLDEGLVFAFF